LNVAVPFMVAETFRASRIVAFSTLCVYPYVDVQGSGAAEDLPATPPPGDYASSCAGREQMFIHGSRRHGTPGRLVRLSYCDRHALRRAARRSRGGARRKGGRSRHGLRQRHLAGRRERAGAAPARALHGAASPLNVTGPEKTGCALARERVRPPARPQAVLSGTEAGSAWLADTTASIRLFAPRRCRSPP